MWSDHEIESASIIKDYCNLYFKYGYTEVSALKEFVKEREDKYAAYQKSLAVLDKKKEKLWSTKDVTKWSCNTEETIDYNELLSNKTLAFSKMLCKETKELEKLKDEFSFWNFQVKSETRNVFYEYQTNDNHQYTELGKALASHSMKMHGIWIELIENLAKIKHEYISS